ncbi:DUF6119 family protein [Bengtsoniella intestinalis]|uniref:DUF6119 family protein n=1 Tax=Bengtsoniella intestinalis TaxID=3073143 RepID=UPI00391F4297
MSATNQTGETQYSIYKINFEEVENVFQLKEDKTNKPYVEKTINALVNSIVRLLNKKPKSIYSKIDFDGFFGVVFKTVHDPSWQDMANLLIEKSTCDNSQKNILHINSLTNSNVSYVLLYQIEENLFAMTGGYGSNYITKFAEKNFGIYLLPKIFEKDSTVIKQINQNSLTGNQSSSQHANRKPTSFSLERDMSNIFRQLGVEATKEIAEKLGIYFDDNESENKKVNILNKDSIVIRRPISLSQLKKVLSRIVTLEKSKDNFVMNYLVLAKKKGFKNTDLFSSLIEAILNEDYNNFILVGDDYQSYYLNASTYCLIDEQAGEKLIEQSEPILFKDVIEKVKQSRYGLTISSLTRMLKKYSIETYDNVGNVILYRISLFNSIQGHIDFGANNIPCFLFNGTWYVIDAKYEDQLKDEFASYVKNIESNISEIAKSFNLLDTKSTEDQYNQSLYDNPNVLVAHTILESNIEIADAIFFDDEKIYYMHNKTSFSGAGARDIINQIQTAANYFQIKLAQSDREDFLRGYYSKIKELYIKNAKTPTISEQDFIDLMISSRKKCYIAGFIKSFSTGTRSNYAKYLTVETQKRLTSKGYEFLAMSLSK